MSFVASVAPRRGRDSPGRGCEKGFSHQQAPRRTVDSRDCESFFARRACRTSHAFIPQARLRSTDSLTVAALRAVATDCVHSDIEHEPADRARQQRELLKGAASPLDIRECRSSCES